MPSTKQEVVLGDNRGNYYAIPTEIIESYRVSDEHKSELEKRIGRRGEDVAGYMLDPNPSPPPAPQPPPGGNPPDPNPGGIRFFQLF